MDESAEGAAPGAIVDVVRGDRVESRHRVRAVFVEADGEDRYAGKEGGEAFWRSSMKPFQALPLVEDGVAVELGLERADLAVCASSHTGTPGHLERVRHVLARAGVEADRLLCGSHPPFDDASARDVVRRGGDYSPLHNNCSGKHAGMLALAAHHGWPQEDYLAYDHPVQRRIRAGLRRWIGRDPDALAWGTDGCGVPTPCLPLATMTRAYARLSRAAREGDGAPRAVVAAMTAHPSMVAGPGRLATRLMTATDGDVLAKGGAEGVLCGTSVPGGWAFAVKVVDGARRALGPAVLAVLSVSGVLEPSWEGRLEDVSESELRNNRGEVVGRLVARVGETGAGP